MCKQNAVEAKVHGLYHQWLAPLGPENFFLVVSYLDQVGSSKPNKGKFGPTAPNFGQDIWAQFRASQETIFSSKIITKIGCCGAKFSLNMTWGRLIFVRNDQTTIFRDGGTNSTNAQFGKTQFFETPCSCVSHQSHLSMKFRFQMLLASSGKCQTKGEISVKF